MIVGQGVGDWNIERQHDSTRLIAGRIFAQYVDLVAVI